MVVRQVTFENLHKAGIGSTDPLGDPGPGQDPVGLILAKKTKIRERVRVQRKELEVVFA